MTITEIIQDVPTGETCLGCGAEIVLVADEAPASISVTCGCGSASALD